MNPTERPRLIRLGRRRPALIDGNLPCPVERAELCFIRRDLDRALDGLSPFKRAVIILRYGLRGAHVLTAEEVARVLKTTRERVVAATYLTQLRLARHPSLRRYAQA